MTQEIEETIRSLNDIQDILILISNNIPDKYDLGMVQYHITSILVDLKSENR